MAHELNWTTFMGHEFPMKHHIMETYQESSMKEPWKTINGSWNKTLNLICESWKMYEWFNGSLISHENADEESSATVN